VPSHWCAYRAAWTPDAVHLLVMVAAETAAHFGENGKGRVARVRANSQFETSSKGFSSISRTPHRSSLPG